VAYPMTADGLQSFLTYLADKGLVPSNSAGGIKTACDKVFSALDEGERNSIAAISPEEAVRRFMNKNPGTLSPDSAAVYQSRIQRALRMLNDFNSNPAGFKVQGSKKPASEAGVPSKSGGAKKSEAPKRAQLIEQREPAVAPSAQQVPCASTPGASVSLSFPLRETFMAQFILPRDLTAKEAKKLARYLEVLAVDFESS
jgi:hypothetical protein